jgi:hypothetical protein
MRIVRNQRDLSQLEIQLASSVFRDSLPDWSRIKITDGLGPIPTYNKPYTVETMGLFLINVGPDVYPDATLARLFQPFGEYRNIFIHEMTHVWHYYHGYWVILRCSKGEA